TANAQLCVDLPCHDRPALRTQVARDDHVVGKDVGAGDLEDMRPIVAAFRVDQLFGLVLTVTSSIVDLP
ncbi:MAG: hypothetical protein ACT4QD_17625, partial [Acidobacteriota bacterium]